MFRRIVPVVVQIRPLADDTYDDGVEEFRTLFATMTEHEDSEVEDNSVLTVFYWFDDEPADEDDQWAAAMYDGHDEYDGPMEAPDPVQRAASPSMQAPISESRPASWTPRL